MKFIPMILADTGMNPAVVAIVAIIAILIIVAIANVKIVPQGNATVIEWLGRYQTTWGTGMHWKVPFFQRIAKNIVLMEQVADFPPQPVITKDNVKMQIDAVVFYQITDCKLYAYGHANPMAAIENLTATTLRNLIGELELDATLTSRDVVNVKMRAILDEATDPWGIKVTRVELKNIMPPREIQDAMEKQMKAERERREAILKAEGEKKSSILIAEGQKASKILAAEAEKEAKILAAEAEKQAKIAAAEGEAEAILKVQTATAEGIRMINDAAPTNQVLAIKSLEAMEKVADGKATKIIIPSNLQGLAGLTTTASELFKAE